jgi:hypothetical protein
MKIPAVDNFRLIVFKMIQCLQKSHHPYARYEIWSIWVEYLNADMSYEGKLCLCEALYNVHVVHFLMFSFLFF